MMRSGEENWRFDALTREQMSQVATESTVVVPLGSIEQHGHHLPVRVDNAIVSAIAELAVKQASKRVPLLLTPTVPFGFAHHHLQFGGTISISSLTYVSMLTDIVYSLERGGFRRVVFLNGHGGNVEAMELVTDRLNYEMNIKVAAAATSYWTVGREALESAGLTQAHVPGHAGHFETSLLLAICPDLVNMHQRPNDAGRLQPIGVPEVLPATVRRSGLWESSDGRTDDAGTASQEYGESALQVLSTAVAEFLEAFHKSTE